MVLVFWMDRKYIMPWQVANFSADFIKFHKILAGDASNIVDVLEILEILEILEVLEVLEKGCFQKILNFQKIQ